MPNFVQTVRLNKLPVTGIVPEKSGTAPTSPVSGQLWTDTSVTPNVVRQYNGTTWDPWLVLGTVAGSAADASTVLVKANNLSDLTNAATARNNLGLGTAATTNTGTGATNTILGNDARLTDQRTPLDNSVTGGTAGTGVKIAASTITLANLASSTFDQAAATASLRTLGTGAQQALAGNTRLDQISAPTTAVSFNGQRLTNLGAPTTNTDAARLVDVQSAAAGIDAKPSVRAASVGNVPVATGLVNGAVVDGVTLATGDRVLLKNQTAPAENGSYVVVASGAASRSEDTITPNSFWFVEEGSQADTQWVVTTNGTITPGTTAVTITQFGAATNYTGTANRITVTGTVIDISSAYVGQTSITTLGTITTGTWTGTAIAVARGGTGATDAATARTNLNVSQRGFSQTLGAVTAGTPVTITHNLGTQDAVVVVRDTSSNEEVKLDIIFASTNTVTVTAGMNFAANALRAVVIPVS